jgi:hypothetical protein
VRGGLSRLQGRSRGRSHGPRGSLAEEGT